MGWPPSIPAGVDPSTWYNLLSSIYGANADTLQAGLSAGGQYGAAQQSAQAAEYNAALDYMLGQQQLQNNLQLAGINQQTGMNVAGINEQSAETVAGTQAAANEYNTQQQLVNDYLQNQNANFGTSVQQQLGLGNIAANQYGTQANYDVGMANAAQQQLQNEVAAYSAALQNQSSNLGTAANEQLGLANTGANIYDAQLGNQAANLATASQNQVGLAGALANVYGSQAGLSGQELGAQQQQYATDVANYGNELQNQSANLATAAGQQSALAGINAGQTEAAMNAQQQQLQTDAARYNTAAGIQQAGIAGQAGEQQAATSAAASELPSLIRANEATQLMSSPLVQSILGQGQGFSFNSGVDPSQITGAVNAAENPNLMQPQVAQYSRSQFNPIYSQSPTGLNPSQYGSAPAFSRSQFDPSLAGSVLAGAPSFGNAISATQYENPASAPSLPAGLNPASYANAPGLQQSAFRPPYQLGAAPTVATSTNPASYGTTPTSFPMPTGAGQLQGVQTPQTSGGWNNPGSLYVPAGSSGATGVQSYQSGLPSSGPVGPTSSGIVTRPSSSPVVSTGPAIGPTQPLKPVAASPLVRVTNSSFQPSPTYKMAS